MNIIELFNKAKRLTNSTTNHIVNGLLNVSEKIKEDRLNICKSCDKFNSSNNTCNECGCFLNIKTSWASEKCPLDKWLALTDQEINSSNILSNSNDCGCGKKNV